jgi:hypothetical protein
MLTVDDYAKSRLAHRDGMSIRDSARTFGHSRRKVRQVLAQAQPKPSTRRQPPPAPLRMPRACAFRAVTVKGYVDRVEVVDGGQVVAWHVRSYGRDEQVLEPLHYLATLGRRPAALDHAPVLRDGRLPESFGRLGQALEARHGPPAGARHYVRVLQLLAEHPLERVEQAAGACLRRGELHAERVAPAAVAALAAGRQRAAGARRLAGATATPEQVTSLCQFQVPRPDLGRFNQLLSHGDSEDGR